MRSALLALALATSACIGGDIDDSLRRAEVLDVVSIDPLTDEVEFELVDRELTMLDNLDRLENPYLRLSRGGDLVIRDSAGSVVTDGEFFGAAPPDLRVSDRGGVVVKTMSTQNANISR